MANLERIRLQENMRKIGLSRIPSVLDNYIKQATEHTPSYLEFLDNLFQEEVDAQEEKAFNTKVQRAHFPYIKRIEDFDFSFQASLNKAKILNLASLSFIENKENVLFLGPPGVGKTHLAIGLGVKACMKGYNVLFTTCHDLMFQLLASLADNSTDKKIRRLSRYYQLLVIDELGYLPLTKEQTGLFFQIVSKRYERSSLILTSNKPFNAWGELLVDSVVASAILDRLLHHATVISISGESYRLKDKKKKLVEKEPKV